jgi:hypothetical protein
MSNQQNEMAVRMFALEKALQTHGPAAVPEKVLKTAESYLKFVSPTKGMIVSQPWNCVDLP